VVYQTTFQWHIYSAIFVPKITGIGQLLLKLSMVVGWYPFLRQCTSGLSHLVHVRGPFFWRLTNVIIGRVKSPLPHCLIPSLKPTCLTSPSFPQKLLPSSRLPSWASAPVPVGFCLQSFSVIFLVWCHAVDHVSYSQCTLHILYHIVLMNLVPADAGCPRMCMEFINVTGSSTPLAPGGC